MFSKYENLRGLLKVTSGLMSMTDGGDAGGQNGPVGGSGNPWSWSNYNPFKKTDNKPNNNADDNKDGDNKDNNDNNIEDNMKTIQDMWSDAPKDQDKKDAPPTVIQAQLPTTPKDELKAHLDEMGLGDLSLTEQEVDAFKNGENVPAILGKINQRIQTGYLKAMSNLSTVMDKKVEAAVRNAVQQSADMYQGERLRDILHEELPFSKDPAIGPIAETVLSRFLRDKKMSKKDAVEATRNFFKHVHRSMDPDYVEPNPNQKGSFRTGNNPPPGEAKGRPAGENASWLATLQGANDSRKR